MGQVTKSRKASVCLPFYHIKYAGRLVTGVLLQHVLTL
jgi:hypothetical protein